MEIKFKLNGEQVKIDCEPTKRLLDVLRDDFGLCGVKEGCGEGECGACAVLIDDELANSCLVALGTIEGKEITTIEGLRETDEFKEMEQAFTTAGSVQCGFCTPGFVMASVALLRKNPQPSEDEIRDAISGNLCRCTGYNLIIEGIKLTAKSYPQIVTKVDTEDKDARSHEDFVLNVRGKSEGTGGCKYEPASFDEALKIRRSEQVIPFAGGTDLMVQKRNWAGLPAKFDKPALFIGHLDELKKIKKCADSLHIGACCSLTSLLEHPDVPEILKKAIAEIASPAIRNIGTIGGNICNASPAGDTLSVLYALDAKVIIHSKIQKIMRIQDFITGPGKKNLQGNELLYEIVLPLENFDFAFYKKVGTRKANALSKLSFAALAKKSDGKFSDFRFAFGAVAPTVVRSQEIEKFMQNKTKDELIQMLSEIEEKYSQVIKPIDDQRSDADYRKNICLRLLRHFILELIN